jgi:hypothetical protein
MQLLELYAWFDAKLFDEVSAPSVVRGQRIGTSPAVMQSGNELEPEAFAQRVGSGRFEQLSHHLRVASQSQVKVESAFQRLQPLFAQTRRGLAL